MMIGEGGFHRAATVVRGHGRQRGRIEPGGVEAAKFDCDRAG
jgi:hypothetical protein